MWLCKKANVRNQGIVFSCVGDYSQPGPKGLATQPAHPASKQAGDWQLWSGVQLIGVDKPGPH